MPVKASRLPFGLNTTLKIGPAAIIETTSLPVDEFHTFIVPSRLPAAIWVPFGLNIALITSTGRRPEYPFRENNGSPVVASHTHTEPSGLADTIRLPSGLNAILLTEFVCLLKILNVDRHRWFR
jgi:hypothetical protein